jgi:urease accessory protein
MLSTPERLKIDPAPALAQRARGEARITVKLRGGTTRIDRLYQSGCAKMRLPKTHDDDAQAVLINTSGGLTGGDRIDWGVALAARTSLVVTTQACERIYRSTGEDARVSVDLAIGAGARLAWLPQETILFDRARFARSLTVEMASASRLLLVEPIIFGRAAMAETVNDAFYRDRWRIHRGGALIYGEDLRFDIADDRSLARKAVLGGATAIASVLLIADDCERYLDRARAIIGDDGGASCWQVAGSGKLLARLHGGSGYALRQRLMPLIALLNEGAALPKLWTL